MLAVARVLSTVSPLIAARWSRGTSWRRIAVPRGMTRTTVSQGTLQLTGAPGTIVALGTWLKWLYKDRRDFSDPAQVAARLAGLVQRVEEWQP